MTPDPRDGVWRLPAGALGDRLDRHLKVLLPGASWRDVRDLVARGKVTVDGEVVLDDGAAVAGGQEIAVRVAARRAAVAAAATADVQIVHEDRHLVVVHKPAGLDTVPWTGAEARAQRLRENLSKPLRGREGGRQNCNLRARNMDSSSGSQAAGDSLERRLGAHFGATVRVVHRLDRDTTGLLVFARTREAEGKLAHQLRRHSMHRRYHALVHGACAAATIRTFLADDRGDGLRGSVGDARLGKLAVTHVEPVEALVGATLVACRLETGRTHQIRIHLAERGHMLLGERAYVREHLGPTLPAPRILLHAAELGFLHPSTDAPLRFSAPMPDDMAAAVAALRGG